MITRGGTLACLRTVAGYNNPVVEKDPPVNVPGTKYGFVAQEHAATEFSEGNVVAVQTDLKALGYESELEEVK